MLLLLLGLGSVTCRPYENGTPSSDAGKHGSSLLTNLFLNLPADGPFKVEEIMFE